MVRLEPGHSVPRQRHDDRPLDRHPAVHRVGYSAALIGVGPVSAESISSIERPLVSIPRIRNATAANAAQNARNTIAGRIAPTVAAGLTKFDPPTISARPSGLMILPRFPTPSPNPMPLARNPAGQTSAIYGAMIE